jgi:protein-L-isoaspartate(D-aspartate) O-methyltransferase
MTCLACVRAALQRVGKCGITEPIMIARGPIMPDFPLRRRMMVDTQVRPSDVTKYPIIAALLDVPREEFVPAALKEAAYIGENLPLSADRVLLEPRTFAKMLDALDVTQADLVLDVGCATGYSSAVLARLAQAVVALEVDPAFVAEAEALLPAFGAESVLLTQGALEAGDAGHAPFDAMILQGGISKFPDTLGAQLREGGRVVALFMDGPLGVVRLGRRENGMIAWRDLFNAAAPVLPGFARIREFTL